MRGNPALERMLGVGSGAEISRGAPDCAPYRIMKDGREREVADLPMQRAAQGEMVAGDIVEVLRADGTVVMMHSSAAPLYDDQGRPRGAAGAFADVTEQQRTEHALQQRTADLESANQELEAFNYAVAHDLRAPLRHIHGFAEILAEEAGPELSESARRHLKTIQNGVRRMAKLLEDMLSLARLGRQELRRQNCLLGGLVREVVADLEPETRGRHVEWRIPELPGVECDPALMKQVLYNLLANAVKFTRTRAPAIIEIGQVSQDGEQVIFVRDNGVGFNMKFADKLFGIFQRLHRTQDFEGTGVGLAIVQRLIRRHGGRVWVEAELDRGATFYVSLPAGEAKQKVIHATA